MPVARRAPFGPIGPRCRLGLATRGNTSLGASDVLHAIERGVDYLNWCGHDDGMSAAIRSLTEAQRARVCVAVQIGARSAEACRRELEQKRRALGTDVLDVATYYYVEHPDEWEAIHAPGGAAEALREAKEQGVVRMIGLTSHQRPLAAGWARTGELDMVMIRYNAAHRGAEEEVFPVTAARDLPVVTFTSLRWGALLEPTPDDPPDFSPPPAPDWYRFVLAHPAVSVALMAPDGRAELDDDLALLDGDWGLDEASYAALRAHGDRVRRHAPRFP